MHSMMLVVASVQFALATGHVITLLVQLIRAFVGEAGVPNGTLLYLLNQATPEHVAQEVFYITNVRPLTSKICAQCTDLPIAIITMP
jgi:Na+/H+-dicarboxylate symporter